VLAVSEWFRGSGIYFYPLSVQQSDLFDLTQPAEITVSGVLAPADGNWIEVAPSLNWSRDGVVARNYTGVQLENGILTR
ncbi:MAG: hypothetical protein B1H09_05385, partial [Gemmatimonadaceae bacterium 4484_173]